MKGTDQESEREKEKDKQRHTEYWGNGQRDAYMDRKKSS